MPLLSETILNTWKEDLYFFFWKIIKLNNGKFWECTILTCFNWYCPKQIYLYYTSDLQWHKVQNQTSRLDLVFLFEEQWVLTDAGDNRITSIFDVPSSKVFYWFLPASSSPGITCLVIMWHRNDRTLCTICLIDINKRRYFVKLNMFYLARINIHFNMKNSKTIKIQKKNHDHWNVCPGNLKEREEGWLHQLVSELHSAAGIPIIQLVTRITCYHPSPCNIMRKVSPFWNRENKISWQLSEIYF